MAPQVTVVENLPLADLQLDPHNPRVHSKRQVRQIARSIEVFGFNVPVLINAEGRLIAGHGRVLAARLLGLKDVPAIRLPHLTEAQARAFMIADNRLTENSAWDERLLAEQLQALSALNLDFNVEVTGFEMAQVDATIESFLPASRGKADPADAIPEHETRTQVTRAGDCWILDRHRVYSGDARIGLGYSTLMKNRRAEMVFADPPLIGPVDRYRTGLGKLHQLESAVSGETNAHAFTDSLADVLRNLAGSSVDGALHYICTDWHHAGELLGAATSIYTEFKDLCVWVKENVGQGSVYRSQHELIFVFKNGKNAHRENMKRGQCGRYRTNVWHYSRANSIDGFTGESDQSSIHSTVKPVELVADAILDCTARGDMVLDPFLGVGTTVIASERTGRICYGMELDSAHLDTTIRRWQAFTGQSALEESTGRTFNELEEESHER